MKDIYYCTKIDKKGNKLTSGYTTKKGADSYGKGCTVQVDILKADFSDPSKLQIKDRDFDGPLIRGLLTNHNPPVETVQGDFVIWGKQNQRWFETPYSFPSYSAANSVMKSIIDDYQAMAIVDIGEQTIEEKIDEPVESAELGTEL